ncbi:MAG: TolC family protein [Chitinophagaceae bacterium]|nr:TolC family protein [Chitinophagaceae bacterium]
MKKFCFLCFCTVLLLAYVSGQEKWSIVRCVEYAIQNNISVRQADLQARFSELNFIQSKASQLPSLNVSASTGYRFGRSENPTTGVLEDNNFFNLGMQVQSGVTLFNWFSRKNNREAARFSWEADKQQTQKIKDDIALNVAVAYLQVLLAKEQVNLSKVQLEQTREQLKATRKRVDAGALPELNAAELEAQLARDSSSLVSAESNVQLLLLQMKALLNLDAGVAFDIEAPSLEVIPVEPLANLQPEDVYQMALRSLPQQRVNALRIQSAKKSIEASRAAMYPSFSAFGGLGTNYVNIRVPQFVPGPLKPTGATVNVNGTDYVVQAPSFILAGEKLIPLGTQFRNNFAQQIGIGISVPVFNGRGARTAWERNKLTLQQLMLQKEQDELKLKQDIYKAYQDAVAALQKYQADEKAVTTAEKAYYYAQKRYDLNLLSAFDLINSRNNLQRAKIQALYSRYDYVFKMKLLEFYKGQGLRLTQ